jgi:hypothetical protein
MSIFSNGNYQQVGGSAKYRKYDLWDAGDQLAGRVVEIRKDKFGKPAYVVEVQDVAFKKTSEQPSVGDLFLVNNAGGLQYKIDQVGGVVIGDVIGIEYNGKVDIQKGKWKGSKAHDIDFFISKEGKRSEVVESEVEEDQDLI